MFPTLLVPVLIVYAVEGLSGIVFRSLGLSLEVRNVLQSMSNWSVLFYMISRYKGKIHLIPNTLQWWMLILNFGQPLLLGTLTFVALRPCLSTVQVWQGILFGIITGVLEEMFWRDVLINRIASLSHRHTAWLLSSCLFGLRHVIWAGLLMPEARVSFSVPMAVISAAAFGLLWGYEVLQHPNNIAGTVIHHVIICILAIYPSHFNILNHGECKAPIDFF